jgi:hypothetical protein
MTEPEEDIIEPEEPEEEPEEEEPDEPEVPPTEAATSEDFDPASLAAKAAKAEADGDWAASMHYKARALGVMAGMIHTPSAQEPPQSAAPPSEEEIATRISEAEAAGDWTLAGRLKGQRLSRKLFEGSA